MIIALQDLNVQGHLEWSSDSLRTQLMDPEVQGLEGAVEALISVSVMKGQMTRLRSTLSSLARTGAAPRPISTRVRKTATNEEQIVATVYPLETADKFGPQGKWTGELWLEPGHAATQASRMMEPAAGDAPTAVCVVLGAGNQGFLTVIDTLDVLFVQNETVLVKHHPLRGYQDRFMRVVFRPLFERGFMGAVFDTTVAESSALVSDPRVGHVHMTGGKATHDSIMWGSSKEESENRRSRNEPRLKARMTAELGCVTPWIVVPAVFTEKELLHQASHLAAALNANGSCNCNAPKCVLMSDSWKQREQYVEAVKSALRELPPAPPYYPGETGRYERFRQAYPSSSQHQIEPNKDVVVRVRVKSGGGDGDEGGPADLPFLTIDVDVDYAEGTCENDFALVNEAFAPVVAFVTVKGATTTKSYMEAASNICNEKMFGTLSCTVILHPETQREHPIETERMIANLRYGTVCVNAWTALCYAVDTCAWGAYPGEDPRNAESGSGFVRNTLMFDHVQKSVVRSPLVDQGQIVHVMKPPMNKKENIVDVVSFILKPGIETFGRLVLPRWCCTRLFCGSLAMVAVVGCVVIGVLASQQ
jgi:acyl-CoA reductase-like NAD-dependent aldehyde dehydrogenase